MMVFGISGMVTALFIRLMRGTITTSDIMYLAVWATIAICGAIKESRR